MCFLATLALSLVDRYASSMHGLPFLTGSWGTLSVLAFGTVDNPAARPWNCVVATVLASIVAAALVATVGTGPVARAAGVAIALACMMQFGAIHPPARRRCISPWTTPQRWRGSAPCTPCTRRSWGRCSCSRWGAHRVAQDEVRVHALEGERAWGDDTVRGRGGVRPRGTRATIWKCGTKIFRWPPPLVSRERRFSTPFAVLVLPPPPRARFETPHIFETRTPLQKRRERELARDLVPPRLSSHASAAPLFPSFPRGGGGADDAHHAFVFSSFIARRSSRSDIVRVNTSSCPTMCPSVPASWSVRRSEGEGAAAEEAGLAAAAAGMGGADGASGSDAPGGAPGGGGGEDAGGDAGAGGWSDPISGSDDDLDLGCCSDDVVSVFVRRSSPPLARRRRGRSWSSTPSRSDPRPRWRSNPRLAKTRRTARRPRVR